MSSIVILKHRFPESDPRDRDCVQYERVLANLDIHRLEEEEVKMHTHDSERRGSNAFAQNPHQKAMADIILKKRLSDAVGGNETPLSKRYSINPGKKSKYKTPFF